MYISVNKAEVKAAMGCVAAAAGLMIGVFVLVASVIKSSTKLVHASLGCAVALAAVLLALLGITASILKQVDENTSNSETCFVEVSPALVRSGLAMCVLGYALAAVTGLVLLFVRYDKLTTTGKETDKEANEMWGTFGISAAIIALLVFPASVFTNMTILVE